MEAVQTSFTTDGRLEAQYTLHWLTANKLDASHLVTSLHRGQTYAATLMRSFVFDEPVLVEGAPLLPVEHAFEEPEPEKGSIEDDAEAVYNVEYKARSRPAELGRVHVNRQHVEEESHEKHREPDQRDRAVLRFAPLSERKYAYIKEWSNQDLNKCVDKVKYAYITQW